MILIFGTIVFKFDYFKDKKKRLMLKHLSSMILFLAVLRGNTI